MRTDRLNRNNSFPFFLIVYLLISEVLGSKIFCNSSVFRYSDEIVAAVLTIIVFFKVIKKNNNPQSNRGFFLLLVLDIIGIIGNILYGVQNSKYAIILDIVACNKLFITFYGFFEIVQKNDAMKICTKLSNYAKAFLIAGLGCGLLSSFMDIGMRGQYRFGFYGFNFIFSYAHLFAMMVIVAVQIISISERNEKIIKKYVVVSSILMILTLKGPSFIWVATINILYIFFKKHEKIRLRVIIGLGIVGALLGTYQIKTYFLNPNSPRSLLYKNAIIIANKYFPLGSGFATYGSDMAAKYYSPIYDWIGFSGLWGMSENDTKFLNDNYWPLIIGQFGWIGLIVSLCIFYMIYKLLRDKIKNIRPLNRSITMSAFIYVLVHSIGSSTPTTSTTLLVFIFIAFQIILCEDYPVSNSIKDEEIDKNKAI